MNLGERAETKESKVGEEEGFCFRVAQADIE